MPKIFLKITIIAHKSTWSYLVQKRKSHKRPEQPDSQNTIGGMPTYIWIGLRLVVDFIPGWVTRLKSVRHYTLKNHNGDKESTITRYYHLWKITMLGFCAYQWPRHVYRYITGTVGIKFGNCLENFMQAIRSHWQNEQPVFQLDTISLKKGMRKKNYNQL